MVVVTQYRSIKTQLKLFSLRSFVSVLFQNIAASYGPSYSRVPETEAKLSNRRGFSHLPMSSLYQYGIGISFDASKVRNDYLENLAEDGDEDVSTEGDISNEVDIHLRKAKFDEEYIEERPQDTDAAEDDNISDDDNEDYVEPLKKEEH